MKLPWRTRAESCGLGTRVSREIVDACWVAAKQPGAALSPDLVAYEARARECETAFEMERHFVGGGVAAMQAAHERRKARKRPAETLDEDHDGGGAAAPRAEHGDDAAPIGPPRRVEGRSLRPAPARRDEGRAADGSQPAPPRSLADVVQAQEATAADSAAERADGALVLRPPAAGRLRRRLAGIGRRR